MIIKLKKGIYNSPDDYAVLSEIGDVLCKVARLKKGYYLYNKNGEQIAQITFDKNTATLVIARNAGSSVSALKIVRAASDSFSFITNEVAKEDERFAKSLKENATEAFSVWGDTAAYNYNLFLGNKVAAYVVPSVSDSDSYLVKLGEVGNLLQILMIIISTERLNNEII